MNHKILVLSNGIVGLYNFRKEVFQQFRELGWEVVISAPTKNREKQADWFRNIGCEIVETTFERQGMNPLADFKLMLYYKRLIKRIKPDVVLSYTIKPNLYGGLASRLCGVPQIANITGLGAAVENPGTLQKITIMLYKICMCKTSVVFFQNDENRQFCLSHNMLNGKNILIPGSGVNLDFHQRQPYPEESAPIRFVFCSRIRKEKGIEQFIETAKYIRNKYPNTEFHVLGGCEGNYESRLKQLTDDNVIVYHGRQNDVRPFFAMGNCTIHPTFYPEGMSNVLLESCATGRPVITTDRAGCREIVDDGVNGYIVKEQDSADLIEKVEKFINLSYAEKQAMGVAARQKVEREFDRKIVVNAYLNAVNELVKK